MMGMTFDPQNRDKRSSGYLDGQMLIAMPGMSDPRFARSVVFICAHSHDGALGIVINQRARKVNFPELLVQLKVIDEAGAIRLPERAGAVQVLKGGPVDRERGFVLHSADYHKDEATLAVANNISLTATVDILRAIADGEGPDHAVLALGYAGWSPGQLESELQQNAWLSCEADPDLIFDTDLESKYPRAMRKLGIDPAMLSAAAGHA